MSALDVKQAKIALAYRLREWGTPDPDAKAAEFIDSLVSRGWQMSPDREQRPRPPKPNESCHACGRAMHTPDRVCDRPTTRPAAADKAPPTDTYRHLRHALRMGTEGDADE